MIPYMGTCMATIEPNTPYKLITVPPDNACSELPSVESGGVVYSDLNLAPGCVGRYICNEGYVVHTLNGRREFTCTEDGVWDGDVLKVPVQCVCKYVSINELLLSQG